MSGKFIFIFILGVGLIIGGAAIYLFKDRIYRYFYVPTETKLEQGLTAKKNEARGVEVIAEGLVIPWEIAFLPNGDPEGKPSVSYGAGILVTERPGTLKKIGSDKKIYVIEGVEHIGEGGLLGMALHPRFSENRWIYLYLTTKSGEGLINRVERYRFTEDHLSEKTTIIDNIPGAVYHDGGRIAFGPSLTWFGIDDYLYITTGDAGNSQLAQNINSLAGKILRINDDGSIPAGNPFGNAVYSYGHRNSQGFAWDGKGQLWATEHGRSGVLSGLDELNLIEKGKNYGWPVIQGDERKEGMESPITQSGPEETWAPAGAVYLDGSIFFTGLRGESIYEAKISEEGRINSVVVHFRGTFGRLRAIKIGRDGFLYVSTSNTDGRGEVRPGDDKIIRINPKIFQSPYVGDNLQ